MTTGEIRKELAAAMVRLLNGEITAAEAMTPTRRANKITKSMAAELKQARLAHSQRGSK